MNIINNKNASLTVNMLSNATDKNGGIIVTKQFAGQDKRNGLKNDSLKQSKKNLMWLIQEKRIAIRERQDYKIVCLFVLLS